jgi:hypothetical protein
MSRKAKKFPVGDKLTIAAALFVGRCVMESPVELVAGWICFPTHLFIVFCFGFLPPLVVTMHNFAHHSITKCYFT